MADDLCTVQELVTDVRRLILDKIAPFRYDDDSIITALNIALLEARRLRPDLFVCRYGNHVPQFEAVSGDIIPVESQFRLAFEYGVCAHVLLRDEEDVQDQRANTFLERFHDMLVGVRPSPITGGTPGADQQK